jgi:hypothetical protein
LLLAAAADAEFHVSTIFFLSLFFALLLSKFRTDAHGIVSLFSAFNKILNNQRVLRLIREAAASECMHTAMKSKQIEVTTIFLGTDSKHLHYIAGAKKEFNNSSQGGEK